jgi:predicted phosphodiesterase
VKFRAALPMRIGIISDIHEDGIRLQQAITALERKNCDFLVCLGDMAGFDHRFYSYPYTRNLSYCLSVIKENCRHSIIGNHDLYVMKKVPKWNPVFNFPENWYALSVPERKKLSNGLVWNFEHDLPVSLEGDLLEWISSLNEFVILEDNELRILLSHSLFPDPTGMLTRKPVKHTDFLPHLGLLAELNCNLGISGHLHPNGVFRITQKKILHGRFGLLDLSSEMMQLVCPCVADGNQDNGIAILDTSNSTIDAIPLRTPKHQIIW